MKDDPFFHPHLPEVARLVAEELGLGAAERLADAMGGEERKIPVDPTGSALEKRVGAAIAACLAAHYGGATIAIPNLNRRAESNRRRVLMNPRKSVNDLVKETGLSARQIRRIRASARDARDPAQPDLFDLFD